MPVGVRALIVDDDASLRYTLEAVLSDAGVIVDVCENGAEALARFESVGADVVLTDFSMPKMDGMALLGRIRALDPGVPVIMLTAHGSERIAVAAIKAGAFDYLPKPFDPEELVLSVKRGADLRALRLDNARLRAEASLRRPIVSESPSLRRVLEMVARVAPKDVTILVTGESGAGKDVVATAIHAHSKRARKPMVRFNAAAIPSELAEAELFGHAKGAFTGAQTARSGFFQQAHGGTLFIDEIGDLPLLIQAKILRALQSGEVQRVGGAPETVDVRLVAATNKDLAEEVRAGRFREDLYYRLNVVPIRVPALRERVEDIEPLLRSFAAKYTELYGSLPVDIDPELIREFCTRPWPGNVRELENTVARLVALTTEDTLTLALWQELNVPAPNAGVEAKNVATGHDDLSLQKLTSDSALPLRARVEAVEKRILEAEFLAAGENQSETARRLRISRPALVEKLHKYGLLSRLGGS
jgi:DNA-binding NtrC family response regulator